MKKLFSNSVSWEQLYPGKTVYDGYRKIVIKGIYGNYAIAQIADFPLCNTPFVIHNVPGLQLYRRKPKDLPPDDAFRPNYHFARRRTS